MFRSATSKGVRLPIEALYQIARSTIVQMFQFLLIIQQLTGDQTAYASVPRQVAGTDSTSPIRYRPAGPGMLKAGWPGMSLRDPPNLSFAGATGAPMRVASESEIPPQISPRAAGTSHAGRHQWHGHIVPQPCRHVLFDAAVQEVHQVVISMNSAWPSGTDGGPSILARATDPTSGEASQDGEDTIWQWRLNSFSFVQSQISEATNSP